jgi:uncharacterized protein YjiK
MRPRPLTVVALLVAAAAAGCRSAAPPQPASLQALWDPADVELVTWQADRRSFQQQFALEASGLAASDRFLYVASEKYARVLQLPIDAPTTARVIAIAVPAHSELEGVAYGGGSLYFCDEAHAAVYEVRLPAGEELPGGDGTPPMPAIELTVAGHDIQPGKVGVEGIVVDSAAHRLWLLLERQGTPETGCVSTIYPLHRAGGALEEDGDPLTIGLPDCDWRLSALELWRGELLALKTQFPGERYELIAIDPATGVSRTVLELTDLLRSVRREGFSNNVEGLAVTADGTLWLVSDNAWTLVVDDPEPPPALEKTLLMRIPPARGARGARFTPGD